MYDTHEIGIYALLYPYPVTDYIYIYIYIYLACGDGRKTTTVR